MEDDERVPVAERAAEAPSAVKASDQLRDPVWSVSRRMCPVSG